MSFNPGPVPTDEEAEAWSKQMDEAEEFEETLNEKYKFRILGLIYPNIEDKVEHLIENEKFDEAEDLIKRYYKKEEKYMEQRDELSRRLHSSFGKSKERIDKDLFEEIQSLLYNPELDYEKVSNMIDELKKKIELHHSQSLNGFFDKK